jgi:hypothetical protein
MDSVESVRAWMADQQNVQFRKRPDPAAETLPPPSERISTAPLKFDGAQIDPVSHQAEEDFNAARTRREISEANQAEMEEAKQRGEYLIKADFERHLFTAGRMLRDTLTNCSRRIGAEVAGSTNPDECEAIIDREHRAALASFAQALRMSIKVTMETPA